MLEFGFGRGGCMLVDVGMGVCLMRLAWMNMIDDTLMTMELSEIRYLLMLV